MQGPWSLGAGGHGEMWEEMGIPTKKRHFWRHCGLWGQKDEAGECVWACGTMFALHISSGAPNGPTTR